MSFVYSFFLSIRVRLSSVSVVFDFNDSLNDVASLFPILFPVDKKINEKELLMDVFCMFSLFCLYDSDRVQ